MSTSQEQPQPLERFFDNFFQERNIRWMLIFGAAIVFGSSLMLVTKSWAEWTPALKILVVVGYTAAIYGGGQIALQRLQLNSTGRVLQTLTLLLLPICFASLTWVGPGSALQTIGLVVPALILLIRASTIILDDWLVGRQATFLISYGLLCVAGGLPVIESAGVAFAFLMVAWVVFSAGVVKVNRHVFWLTESHAKPRVLGFLPIAMLGLQFTVLVAIKAVPALPPSWIGWGMVLVAVTVLQTARVVADVFVKRTGDLVRPLPWAIMAPLLTGVVLALGGLLVSAAGFSYVGPTTFALIPTAMLAAVVFGRVAGDTRHPIMVWLALICVAVAYQSSPVLFADLVASLKAATAETIHRSRVPLSLYGLTYTPLLMTLAAFACYLKRRGEGTLASPVQQFVTILSIGWLAFAATDLTSAFLVSAVNVIGFAVFAYLFADRRYIFGAIVALVAAAATIVPAGNQMQCWAVSSDWIGVVLAGLATILLLAVPMQRVIDRIPLPASRWGLDRLGRWLDGRWLATCGVVLAVALGLHWIFTALVSLPGPMSSASMIQWTLLVVTLLRGVLKRPSYAIAMALWIMSVAAAMRAVIQWGFIPSDPAIWAAGCLVVANVVAHAVVRRVDQMKNRRRIDVKLSLARQRIVALALPALDLSFLVLVVLTGAVFVPAWSLLHVAGTSAPFGNPVALAVVTPFVVGWWFSLVMRTKMPPVAGLVAVLPPLAASTAMLAMGMEVSFSGLCLIWAATQAASMLIYRVKPRTFGPMMIVARMLMLVLVAASCVSFDWLMRVVALLAIVSHCFSLKTGAFTNELKPLAVLGNVHALLAVGAIAGCQGWVPRALLDSTSDGSVAFELIAWELVAVSLSLSVFAAAEWRLGWRVPTWIALLRLAAISLTVGCVGCAMIGLPWIAVVLPAWLILGGMELGRAIRFADERSVWMGLAWWLIGVGYLFAADVISVGAGLSQFVLLGIGVAALGARHVLGSPGNEVVGNETRQSLGTLIRPLNQIGLSMPAIVAILAIGGQLIGPALGLRVPGSGMPERMALNAIAMMLAAGVYFHRVVIHGDRRFLVPAVVIANLGAILLWRVLGWNAIDLYLIPFGLSVLGVLEVFRDRVPASSHAPIQSVALMLILGSPLFQVIGGSWVHMLALLTLSVVLVLAAIGLRQRWLMLTASVCLGFDLVAMVVRSTIHNLNVLWVVGVLIGIAVIALAAVCENHRDKLLQRIRLLSAELATWN